MNNFVQWINLILVVQWTIDYTGFKSQWKPETIYKCPLCKAWDNHFSNVNWYFSQSMFVKLKLTEVCFMHWCPANTKHRYSSRGWLVFLHWLMQWSKILFAACWHIFVGHTTDMAPLVTWVLLLMGFRDTTCELGFIPNFHTPQSQQEEVWNLMYMCYVLIWMFELHFTIVWLCFWTATPSCISRNDNHIICTCILKSTWTQIVFIVDN